MISKSETILSGHWKKYLFMLKTDSKVKMSSILTLFYSSSPFIVKSRNDKFTIQLSVKNKGDSAYNTRVLVQSSPNIIFAGIEVGIFHIITIIITCIAKEFWESIFVSLNFTALASSQSIGRDSLGMLSSLIPLKKCICFDLSGLLPSFSQLQMQVPQWDLHSKCLHRRWTSAPWVICTSVEPIMPPYSSVQMLSLLNSPFAHVGKSTTLVG